MSAVERKQTLFENIVRLRRAARELPGNDDLAAVTAALEDELGPTLSMRLAARLLGVSHTALSRWIKAGDVASVYTPSGRMEVPVVALLPLYESVHADRPARYALAPTMRRQRTEAEHMRIARKATGLHGHERARARGLAYHQVVAQRLSSEMVGDAKNALVRWRRQGKIDELYAVEWKQLLDLPLPEIKEAIQDESEHAADLRQNSPFAGLLSEPDRRRILREVA